MSSVFSFIGLILAIYDVRVVFKIHELKSMKTFPNNV